MKYSGALIAVTDIEASTQFYRDFLGQEIEMDFGANVAFKGGFSLQELNSWADFIDKTTKEISFGSFNTELYFETEDFDAFFARLQKQKVELVHGVKEFPWGQRSVRFYDPDRHILEAGESMEMVLKRFLDAGMTHDQIAQKTEYPLEYVQQFAAQQK